MYLLHQLVTEDLKVWSPVDENESEMADDDEDDDDEDKSCYDSPIAARLKRFISQRLRDRFSLTQDGQPEKGVCKKSPVLVSAFCDPR